uniref:Uncharacterized protein n=1 Tax=Parascaris univalens TaxID=6257 RepID=A0A915BVH4_PARUN
MGGPFFCDFEVELRKPVLPFLENVNNMRFFHAVAMQCRQINFVGAFHNTSFTRLEFLLNQPCTTSSTLFGKRVGKLKSMCLLFNILCCYIFPFVRKFYIIFFIPEKPT